MTDPIRMAIIGCGQIAEAHLKAITALSGAQLTFTMDSIEERARSAAERYGAPSWTTAYEEVLNASEVDAVLLCLPHDLHKPFTIQAAEAGKHILVEKPMARDEAEARDMVQAAAKAAVQLSIGQSTRCIPSVQKAKELLGQNAVGRVVNIVHQRLFWVEKLSTDWRRDLSSCGGLYLPIFGSHDIDTILWLLDAVPERIWCAVRAVSSLSGGDSDGFVGLELAGGEVASLAFSTQCKHSRSETTFVGTEGNLVLTRSSVVLNGETVDLGETEETFTLQTRLFVEALQEGREVPAPGREILKVVRTLDLARRASETGQAQKF